MTEPVWKTSEQPAIRGARSIHASLDRDGLGRSGDVTGDRAFRQAVEAYARHRNEVDSSGALVTHLRTEHRIIQAFSYAHPQGPQPLEELNSDELDYTHWEEHGGQGMEDGVVLSHEEAIARRLAYIDLWYSQPGRKPNSLPSEYRIGVGPGRHRG